MTTIELYDEEATFSVHRHEDESQDVVVTIRTSGTTITVNLGHIYDTVNEFKTQVEGLAADLDVILDGWVDTPEDDDAYLSYDRGAYWARFGGKALNLPGMERIGFPSEGIAAYELAKAMVEAGEFSNIWYENERGYTEPWHEQHRKYFDEGGDGLIPLEGVQYEEHELVSRAGEGWSRWVVLKDYGQYGVWIATDGDSSIRELVEDRSLLSPYEDEDEDEDG